VNTVVIIIQILLALKLLLEIIVFYCTKSEKYFPWTKAKEQSKAAYNEIVVHHKTVKTKLLINFIIVGLRPIWPPCPSNELNLVRPIVNYRYFSFLLV